MLFKLISLLLVCAAAATDIIVTHSYNASLDEFAADLTKIGSKYYYISKEKLNWFQALMKCHQLGYNMIHFENQAELDNVIKHLEAKQNYWTDMHDMGKENEFISITTGAPLKDFPKWVVGQPDNWHSNEHCAHLTFYDQTLLNDYTCYKEMLYICQAKHPSLIKAIIW